VSESELIEDLRSALDDATADLWVPRDAAERARKQGRRRAVRGMLAAVPAVALATGLAVAAGVFSGPRPRPVEPAAYVTKHVHTALSTINRYIVQTTTTTGLGERVMTYSDPTTGSTYAVIAGPTGLMMYWTRPQTAGGTYSWQTTTVDYANHTWWTQSQRSGLLGQAEPAALAPIVLGQEARAAQIAQAVKGGQLRVAGRGDINGHDAIELMYAGQLAAKAFAVQYWVDAQTFQPVQLDFPPFGKGGVINVAWLPRSAAILRYTDTPQVPVGFSHITEPVSPG
jgi:hypothetical protein